MDTVLEQAPRLDLFERSNRGIAFTMLFCEEELAIREQMVGSFESVLAQVSPPLSGMLPFTTVCGGAWAEALAVAVANDRKVEQWCHLERLGFAPFNPVDREGKAAPQCIIVVRAGHLLDEASRKSLINELAKVATEYSQFLIIFVAEAGEIPFDTEASSFQKWSQEFARLFPKPVSLHLVSNEFDDGHPILQKDLSDGLAIALLVDIVSRGRGCVRVLSDTDESLSVVLHAIGIKGFMYEPESATDVFKPVVTTELARQVLLRSPADRVSTLSRTISPRELFASLSLAEQNVAVRIFDAKDAKLISCLCGGNYAVRFDFGEADVASILKAVPPCDWPESLSNRREILSRVTLTAAGLRISNALAELRASRVRDLVDQLADAFAHTGLLCAQKLCQEFGNQISDIYWSADPCGTSDVGEQVEKSLAELNQVVKRIPSMLRLALQSFVRVLPIFAVVLLAWLIPPSFQTLCFCICAAVSGFGICYLAWSYLRALLSARKIAVHAAEVIHDEMRARLHALTREYLVRECCVEREQITAIEKRIFKIIGSVEALQLEPELLSIPNTAGAIKRVPWTVGQLKALVAILRADDSRANLDNEVLHYISGAAPALLDGTTPPSAIADTLHNFSDAFCRKRLGSLTLADFFQGVCCDRRLYDASLMDDAVARLNEMPNVFLQSMLLNDCRSQPHRIRRAALMPTSLATQWCDETSAGSVAENIIAIIMQAELARLPA
jgi:hypothetical protein